MNGDATLAYDFACPEQIVFGWGRRREVGSLARTLGRRAFMICGSRTLVARGVLDEIREATANEGVEVVPLGTVSHEPEVDDVDRLAAKARGHKIAPGDFILAIGGGAAIDLGKAVAAMATNDASPTVKDYLEGVGTGRTLEHDPLPILAMPTTAGTGAEATKNAVISSYDPPFKKSLRDVRMVPRIALIDPELAVSVPPKITAASGMDAITQLFESYLSRKAQPIPRALAVDGLGQAFLSIGEAVRNGTSREAREKMAHAAMLSGMALANSGLGMAHGVAAALGVHGRVPHGSACALLLPVALRVNAPVRREELARLARLLLGEKAAVAPKRAADLLIDEVERLCDAVGVPRRLSDVGITAGQIPAVVAASRGSSMQGNPRTLSDEALTQILEQIL